jgi:hypothetical protein
LRCGRSDQLIGLLNVGVHIPATGHLCYGNGDVSHENTPI